MCGETAVPDAARVVEHLALLLAAARTAGALVIHLQNDGTLGTMDEPGAPGWFIHQRVVPESGEVVLRKQWDDGFKETALAKILSDKGVNLNCCGWSAI